MQQMRGNQHRLAEHALRMGKAHGTAAEHHVVAMVVQPALAFLAGAAGHGRIDGDEIALGQAGDTGADRIVDRRDLVAEDHRLPDPHRAEAALVVIMQVRTADPAGGNADADFALAGF